MNIRPLKNNKNNSYPAYAEMKELKQVASGGRSPAKTPLQWMALVGMISTLTSQHAGAADSERPAVVRNANEEEPLQEPDQVEMGKIAAAVAPFLEEAMQNDGRGSFGCISVSPGWYMSEDEALELIRTELEAAGLRLQRDAVLNDVIGPVYHPDKKSRGEVHDESRPVRFDFADVDKGIYIDFLGESDWRLWDGPFVPLGESVKLPELADRVARNYARYEGKAKITFGIFFDPIADRGIQSPGYSHKLPVSIEEHARREYEKRWPQLKDEKAKWHLRLQVQHFIEYLRSEGVLDDVTEENVP